jgi:hypothetical protein
MSMQQRLMIISALAAMIAIAVLSRKPATTRSASRVSFPFGGLTALCLAVVAGSLVVVGIVSNTMLRHLVQIVPLVVALALLVRRSDWGPSAAVPLFAFWFLVMGAIWLLLLGLARIVSGRFTPAEVTLTVIIGVASLLGLATASRRGASIPFAAHIATIVGFAILQFVAMWLSLQPMVASR